MIAVFWSTAKHCKAMFLALRLVACHGLKCNEQIQAARDILKPTFLLTKWWLCFISFLLIFLVFALLKGSKMS
jgi:hypothetical protein